jgi:site-specific recombinase XerD
MPRLSELLPDVAEPGGPTDDLDAWLDAEDVPDGVPFLVSPGLEYDIDLNRYFLRPAMIGAAQNTRLAAAGDLCRFLRFLHESRGGTSWRDAQEDDHAAFLHWRRFDLAGPRVAASTWNRELALVNGFFAWAAGQQLTAANPVPQRARRAAAARHRHSDGGALVPAAQGRDTGRDEVQWLTPAQYRQWRDTGLRGYRPGGLPDEGFRGRWASRNALFADVMVRTGLRLAEQASLTVGEVPADDGGVAYQRFWLPEAIAKNRSSRWVYLPAGLARKIGEYCAADRAEIIAAARRRGTYDRIGDPLVIDPARGAAPAVVVGRPDGGEAVIRVEQLTPGERTRLLVRTPDGLEPAALWLAEHGMPVSLSGWKGIFRDASSRCARAGVPVTCHPHMLRHSFAVLTLEQLQRGHIAELAGMTPGQRGQYQRIFGDPLDWVRRRLGHRSAETTLKYLHVLQELEMRTRMGLISPDWDDTGFLIEAAG